MAVKKEETFEQREARLEEIIKTLEENKGLSLKQTADLYAEGKALVEALNKELEALRTMVTHEIVEDKQ